MGPMEHGRADLVPRNPMRIISNSRFMRNHVMASPIFLTRVVLYCATTRASPPATRAWGHRPIWSARTVPEKAIFSTLCTWSGTR